MKLMMVQNLNPNYDFFIKTDTSRYKGEWVAISGKKIVTHGNDAQKVYESARKKVKFLLLKYLRNSIST